MRQKSRIRDNTRYQNLKGDSLERLQYSNGKQFSSYKNRQSFGKAVKRVIQSLPQDTHTRVTVVRHIAQELNVIPKNNYSTSTSITFVTNRIARINY
ncbi:unnamed protein product [Rotaria sp. Silwood1]|nr:unnamed protein product [Rotaria sp. Silwood1]